MSPYAIWISYTTIVRKEMVRLFRIWSQTILPPVITSALYFLIFGKFVGSQIPDIQGATYMEFIVPGMVLMAVINNAFMNTAFSFYAAKFQRTLEELMVSPTPYLVVVLGQITSGVFRGIVTAIAILLVALFFTPISIFSFGITLLFVVLTAVLFSLAGLVNGIYADSFDTVSIFPTFILTPLAYLGGVFYAIEMLPPFWQKVSLFNPIVYMIDGFRYGVLGVHHISVWASLAVLMGFILILIAVNYVLFKSGKGLRT
jgi:ABC-2 type transport system permease protein